MPKRPSSSACCRVSDTRSPDNYPPVAVNSYRDGVTTPARTVCPSAPLQSPTPSDDIHGWYTLAICRLSGSGIFAIMALANFLSGDFDDIEAIEPESRGPSLNHRRSRPQSVLVNLVPFPILVRLTLAVWNDPEPSKRKERTLTWRYIGISAGTSPHKYIEPAAHRARPTQSSAPRTFSTTIGICRPAASHASRCMRKQALNSRFSRSSSAPVVSARIAAALVFALDHGIAIQEYAWHGGLAQMKSAFRS